MLALQGLHGKSRNTVPNVLPCRIHRSGPAKVTQRYWSPSHEHDNTKTSYFRGRKLRGRIIKLPAGYRGIATKATEKLLPQQPQASSNHVGAEDSASDVEEDDLEDKPEPVKILQTTATFDEVTVYGHDMLPAADDPFVKGIEEWIAFAEVIHAEPEPQAAAMAS